MRWTLDRRWPRDKYVIGRFYTDDGLLCNSLELPWRDNTPQRSCIPTGVYRVVLAWSPAFKRDLPLLLDVPGRSGIRIHRANYPRELRGCIALGENTKVGCVLNSTPYEKKVCELLRLAASRSEPVYLTIK